MAYRGMTFCVWPIHIYLCVTRMTERLHLRHGDNLFIIDVTAPAPPPCVRFVLDERGMKMSKSLGNTISPVDIIDGGSNQKENPPLGADTLRLWVSSVDYTNDVCIGGNIMKQIAESYRKLRNTLRYLIGNLNDFDIEKDLVPIEQMASLDRYILGRLTEVVAEVETAYENFQFYKVNSALSQFAVTDLSAFYLDVAKDRLYISTKEEFRRRSCQTVLYHLLQQSVVIMAPIVPHMAEDVWQNLPYKPPTSSVFEYGWVKPQDHFPPHDKELWERLKLLKNDVNVCIEGARRAKEAGASQEMQVVLYVPEGIDRKGGEGPQASTKEFKAALTGMRGDDVILVQPESTNGIDDLRFIFLTSQVSLVETMEELLERCPTYHVTAELSESGVAVGVKKANGHKCDRCWFYSDSVGDVTEHPEICPRCADVVVRDGHVLEQAAAVDA